MKAKKKTKKKNKNNRVRLLKIFMNLFKKTVLYTQKVVDNFAFEIKLVVVLIVVMIILPAASIRGEEVSFIREFTTISVDNTTIELQSVAPITRFQLANVEIQGRNVTVSEPTEVDDINTAIALEESDNSNTEIVAELVDIAQEGFDPRLPFGYKIGWEVYSEVSGYNPVPEQTDASPCITASGKNICESEVDVIAANWLKFGTKVRIPDYFGDRIFTVEDRMNKRYPHNTDVLFYDKGEARALGRRTLLIQILEEVDAQVAQK